MPLVDANDPNVWLQLYQSGVYGCSYDRIAKYDFLGQDHYALRDALVARGMQKTNNIVLIGGAFGWVAEDWIADGFVNTKITDISSAIHGRKGQSSLEGHPQASVEIINEDGITVPSRRRIKQAFGSTDAIIHWAITEDLAGFFSDAECLNFAPSFRQLATKVAHWISVGTRRNDSPEKWAGDPRLNWKTIQDWKTLLTPDLVIQRQPPYTVL